MVIGIIGASLSGLVAGSKLAKAGHDVTVIEKSRALGGRLATHQVEGGFFDYGVPFVTAEDQLFKSFLNIFQEKEEVFKWATHFPFFDGTSILRKNPNRPDQACYASTEGLNSLVEYLKRWVDLKSEVKAGGLTYIGPNRGRKRAWMINLTDISVFECDAVILATPATQAYGVLQTAQDETPTRRIIRHIGEVHYQPRYTLMASYKEESPSWKGIECTDHTVGWLGNESSKNGRGGQSDIVIQSSAQFARKNAQKNTEEVAQALLERAAEIADPWLIRPNRTYLRHWKYYETENPIDEYFIELEMDEAPLALIGDYFKGNSAESSFLSGHYLADYWINKYYPATVSA